MPIHLVGARIEPDRRTPGVAGAASMSPHGLVQELLNRSDDHLWGIVSNGRRLRLLRDNVSLTRSAYLEFDLEAMFACQAYADFTLLWLVCHQSRLEGDPPTQCVLERWRADAAERGTRALDQLRVGVDGRGTPLDVGRKTRSIPPAIRRALQARDGGCSFPGCTNRRFVDGHHICHWASGGETKPGQPRPPVSSPSSGRARRWLHHRSHQGSSPPGALSSARWQRPHGSCVVTGHRPPRGRGRQ